MQYLFTLYADESGWTKMTPEQQQQGAGAYAAYTEALKAAGVLKSSNRLQPSSSATTLRTTNGKTQVLDGPFADSKEQLGGYYLIDVPDLMQPSHGPGVALALGMASSRCVPSGRWTRRPRNTRENSLSRLSEPDDQQPVQRRAGR